mmetsp:Transcript_11878/g.15887  ORF Transcript_11878/g.15887 Transcript_11878/m.15887 type:complete len:164 (+) Transcript_11878:135-626(+)
MAAQLQRIKSVALFLVVLSVFLTHSEGSASTMAFVAQAPSGTKTALCSTSQKRSHTKIQSSHENDPTYLDRLREASRSPEAFEKFVMKGVANDTVAELTQEEEAPQPKKKGYQRAEDWEAELKERQQGKGSGMTWEEKVQFDGQRFGNQVRQDVILRKHLGTW